MIKKKRALSLIETVISLGLIALLLSTLFFWYHSMARQKQVYNRLKGPLLEERYAYQRLQKVLLQAELPLFTTEDNSLVFIFDRGPDLQPQLSGKVLGRLYWDQTSHALCLGIWPLPAKESEEMLSQTLVLLDGVTSCAFEFYFPPDPFKKPVDPEAVKIPRPKEGNQEEWLQAYETLPAWIDLKVARAQEKGIDNHSFVYRFDLPVPIVYNEGHG
jgi:type II secretory pathway pseudopilin PulG